MMGIRLLLPVLLLSVPSLLCQTAEVSEQLRARSLAMLQEALASRESHRTLASLLEAAPGRVSGSPAAAKAEEWALGRMRNLGLSNVREEPVLVPRWVRGEICDIGWKVEGAEPLPLTAVALGGSDGTGDRSLTAQVIEVQTFGQLRALPESEVRGKIVFFNRPFDVKLRNTFNGYSAAVNQRSQGAAEAGKLGAVGVVIRSVTSDPDDVPHTGAMNYQAGVKRIPAAALSVVAAEKLSDALKKNPTGTLTMRMDCATLEPVLGANIVGEIRGSSMPEEIVVIGAHLDSWDICDGAHDDGAGVAHCLEAARLILSSGTPPKRTIRVVLFANEENGLMGGRAYAETHKEHMSKHILAIESDSGGFAPRGLSVKGGTPMVLAFQTLDQLLRIYDLGSVMQGGGGADISLMEPYGVPVMGLRVDDHRYFDLHHSTKDNLQAVNPRELALGAAALAMAAFTTADAETVPPRLEVLPK